MSKVAVPRMPRLVQALIGVQLAIYGVIAWLSPLFDFYAAERERPLLLVVSLLLANFALHLWSMAILLKSPDSKNIGWRIVLIALAMRVILIGSTPIQEVDVFQTLLDKQLTYGWRAGRVSLRNAFLF